MKATKNQQIIEGIIKGDEAIIKAFYKKNLPYVRKYILHYQGSTKDVEDVVQEALMLLYYKLKNKELILQKSIHAYFIGVCKNMWRSQWRKQQLFTYSDWVLEQLEDPEAGIIETMTLQNQQALYQKYIATLSPSNTQLLRLFFEGKSMRDIASSMGYTEGYVRKKKYLIKNRLLQMIQKDPMYEELVNI